MPLPDQWALLEGLHYSQRMQTPVLLQEQCFFMWSIPRICEEIQAESFQKEAWWCYRKHQVVLQHFHCAHFWLLHINLSSWPLSLRQTSPKWVLKNRSVEGIIPLLEPLCFSTPKSGNLFWEVKLFCPDQQESSYSTVLECFLGFSLRNCLLLGWEFTYLCHVWCWARQGFCIPSWEHLLPV